MIQFLVSHGHRWVDIKGYSLGEIGVFLKSCRKEDEAKETADVTNMWLSTHASQEFIKDYLKGRSTGEPKPEVSQQEVDRSWKALAGMNGDFK